MCPAKKNGEVERRGYPTVEWYKDGKAQVYCYGYIDRMTDEPLETCKHCADFVENAQTELEGYMEKCKEEVENDG